MGLNSSSTADLAFEDTPAERLGEPGNGMRVALRTLDGGRIGIAAQAVGIAQAALDARDAATPRSATRSAARSPGCGAIQQKLADMQTEIEAARALVWRAARLKEAGKPAHRRGRAGQAVRLRASPAARPARRSRSSAATATPRSSRPSATTATPRSPRSTRARARSSGSSSPARCLVKPCAGSSASMKTVVRVGRTRRLSGCGGSELQQRERDGRALSNSAEVDRRRDRARRLRPAGRCSRRCRGCTPR